MLSTPEFIGVVLTIAILTWGLRYVIDPTHPNPFILDSMFFAFAGQCIRTLEERGPSTSLIFPAFMLILLQFCVIKAHRWTTLAYYRLLLHECIVDDCEDPEGEIDFWAHTLLGITGTDFFPKLYFWLEPFNEEPRSKARDVAISVISKVRTKCLNAAGKKWNAASLIVPSSPSRTFLKWAYPTLCVLSWLCFAYAISLHPNATATREAQQLIRHE